MAKMTVEQFREFGSAVLRQLPPIDSEDGQLFINEQHRLAAVLRTAFRPAQVNSFGVHLTPKLDFEEAKDIIGMESIFKSLRNIVDADEESVKKSWPTRNRRIDFRVVNFGKEISGFDALKALSVKKMRRASVVETVYFACEYSLILAGQQVSFLPLVILEEGDVFEGRRINPGDDNDAPWLGKVFPADTKFAAVAL